MVQNLVLSALTGKVQKGYVPVAVTVTVTVCVCRADGALCCIWCVVRRCIVYASNAAGVDVEFFRR